MRWLWLKPGRRSSRAPPAVPRWRDKEQLLQHFDHGLSPAAYHAFICDREGDTLTLEADHRRHAEIENVVRDLKYGVGLNHLPSGKFAANAAWLAFQVLAHNLGVWVNRLGLQGAPLRTKTLRHRYLALAGRLTHSARRVFLALPSCWPWRQEFMAALTRLRSLPLLA